MLNQKFIYLFFIIIFCLSCSKPEIEKSVIKQNNMELQMIDAYNEGLKELQRGDALFAAKKIQ